MSSSSIAGIFDLLTQKMSYLNHKQGVIAENVANVDTPGYKQLELKPFSFDNALKQASSSMVTTDVRHILPASMAGTNAQTAQSKDTDVQLSGNSVDLEQQMAEVSKTSMDYQMITAIYKKMNGLFKIAIKGSSS
ncbi:MAG: flagellar basal body rod protein FlgB [Alphaproteobacteria bacterium]|nr:flagellar basal body rod protein FlgB [Alphaproteobacteria bacterium]